MSNFKINSNKRRERTLEMLREMNTYDLELYTYIQKRINQCHGNQKDIFDDYKNVFWSIDNNLESKLEF